jgi:MYXO-CTERM domain-containing protein
MRIRTTALTLAIALGLCFGSNARADLPIDVANLSNTEILFAGTGHGLSAGTNITFTNTSSGGIFGSNIGFQVTNPGDSSLVGSIGGTYSYLASNISSGTVLGQTVQTVNVTGTGTLTINDDGGNTLFGKSLTGTINGFNLSSTIGAAGSLNTDATVNLTNLSYSGSNADLRALVSEANHSGGIVTISFQFTSSTTLSSLTGSGNGTHTSYSGSITAASSTPEPSSMAIAGLGALGMFGYGLRRRKASGA